MELHLGRRLAAVFIGAALIVAILFVPFAEGKAAGGEGTGTGKSVDGRAEFASILSAGAENYTVKQNYALVNESDFTVNGVHMENVSRLHSSVERYVTKEASLMILEADLYAYTFTGSDETAERMRLAVSLAYYQSGKAEFLRIDRLQASVNDKIFTGEERLARQWVRIDRKDADADLAPFSEFMYHMTNTYALQDASYTAAALLNMWQDEDYAVEKGVYTLKEEPLQQYFADFWLSMTAGQTVLPTEDMKGGFKVDLSDKTAPALSFGVEGEAESDLFNLTVSQELSAALTNVGNTAISMPDLFIEIELDDFNDIICDYLKIAEVGYGE